MNISDFRTQKTPAYPHYNTTDYRHLFLYFSESQSIKIYDCRLPLDRKLYFL